MSNKLDVRNTTPEKWIELIIQKIREIGSDQSKGSIFIIMDFKNDPTKSLIGINGDIEKIANLLNTYIENDKTLAQALFEDITIRRMTENHHKNLKQTDIN